MLQAWVLVDSSLYAVPLKVPRMFYVNSTLPPDDPTAAALGPRVSRTLPYGAEAHNIYQARLILLLGVHRLECRVHQACLTALLLMAFTRNPSIMHCVSLMFALLL